MPTFEDSGRSMGVAHVEFRHPKAAAKAVQMHECTWKGRWLKIVFHDRIEYDRDESGNKRRKKSAQQKAQQKLGPVPDGCRRIWVGGLPYDATKRQIGAAFEECGEVTSVQISTDKLTGESKGFAHVEFASSDGVQAAVDMAVQEHGVIIGGNRTRIDYAEVKSAKPKTANDKGEALHWKDMPTRSRNRGALEQFAGKKVTF